MVTMVIFVNHSAVNNLFRHCIEQEDMMQTNEELDKHDSSQPIGLLSGLRGNVQKSVSS
jgi:hypothetical protein